MGQPTTGQALNLLAVLANNTSWDSLSTVDIQRAIDSPKESGAAFTAWLKNGCRLVVKGPNTLMIDRSKPFNPATFIGKGWTIDESEDERALALTEIDLSAVSFVSGLTDGEQFISGEEKLKRLKKKPQIRLDAKVGQVLYEEKGQVTLRFIHENYKISWMEFVGTVLRYPNDHRYFLYLYRNGDGSWHWYCYWLGDVRGAQGVSPVSAS